MIKKKISKDNTLDSVTAKEIKDAQIMIPIMYYFSLPV
jgi:hypothetical protein